jgi:hypothetical protein
VFDAVIEHVGTFGCESTITVVWHVFVPPAPETVITYVRVLVRLNTPCEPDIATEPIPWLIETEVALFVVHESVVLPLYPTVLGEAVIEHVGALGCESTVTVT